MGFGWFSKSSSDDKALSKALKLQSQGRWAEALSFYDEVLARAPDSEPAMLGAKDCRVKLVGWNLEEAEAYRGIDIPRAAEHARLALDLAAGDPELKTRASAVVDALAQVAVPRPSGSAVPRQPLFAKSCSCAVPCATSTDAAPPEAEIDVEDLAEFYLESCDPAVREAFERLQGSFRVGFVHLQKGELAEAMPHLEQTLKDQPREPGAPYALGLLASVGGQPGTAAEHFRKALEVDENFGPALRHLAETLRELGDVAGAIDVLSEWLTTHEGDAEARLLLALSRIESGKETEALEDARLAQRLTGDADPRPALLLARAQQLTGDGQAAIATLQGVLGRKPDLLEALVALAELLLRQGGTSAERAAEAFKKCYREDPDHGWWYLIKVAEAYHARGWGKQAQDVLSRAHEELPEDAEASRTWDEVARRLGG